MWICLVCLHLPVLHLKSVKNLVFRHFSEKEGLRMDSHESRATESSSCDPFDAPTVAPCLVQAVLGQVPVGPAVLETAAS